MKKLIVKCEIILTDVFDDSWCNTPSTMRVIETLEKTLKRCMSDKGTVDMRNVLITTSEVASDGNIS